MYSSTVLLLFLSLLFPLYESSGYIEVRLKSAIDLPEARIYENRGEKPDESIPFPMIANETRTLTIDNVDFHKRRSVYVDSGRMAECGHSTTAITADRRDSIYESRFSLECIWYPFTGVRIDFLCHPNWYGPNCDTFCNKYRAKTLNRRCTQNGTVGCPLNFHGPNCDQDINQNGPECECQNKGLCVSSFRGLLKDELVCECPIGWKGNTCEKKNYPESLDLSAFYVPRYPNCNIAKYWSIPNEFY